MRSRSFLSALSLVALLASCRDETNTGGGSEGGNPSDGGNAPSNGGAGAGPSNGGAGAGPSTGGGGQGAGAGPSTGGGGNGPQGGFGGNGGSGPQGGNGGAGGAPSAGETNCIDGLDDDSDTDIDCLDSDCFAEAVCGELVINEVDYNMVGAGDSQEFVEIFNSGLTPIDLDGLSFYRINGSTGAPYSGASGLALTGTLDAGEYLVLGSSQVVVAPGTTVVLFADDLDELQNGPDGVAIYDTNHQVLIDAFAYGGAQTDATIDGLTFDLHEGTAATADDSNVQPISLIRFPNGVDTNNADADWTTTTLITPGAENQQASLPEANCADGVDNDGNGDIDCDDTACSGDPCDANGSLCVASVCSCPGGTMESACNDGNDNDCDGDIDCADANCASAPICGENCADGMDNNGDTLVDCLDPVCAGQICGANGLTCAGTVCACPGGATELACNDAVDNDCDGTTDCADSNCSAAPSCTATVFINEIHYDNTGTDIGEGIEIAATAGLDLTGYSIVHYNGSTGAVLTTTALSGIVPNQSNGFGTVFFAIAPLQNDNEGIALVGPGAVVIEFLSYEGAVTATAGPANGMTAVLIPVTEISSSPVGQSLQLTGAYPALTWAASATATPNALNNGETF